MTEEVLDMGEFEKPEDLKGFSYPAEGLYHCIVNSIDTSREKGNAIFFEGHVLAGTVDGQKGQTWREMLADPSPDHKDGGRFARKRLAAFALATGLVQPAQLGQQATIDWDQAAGRQFVCKLFHDEWEDKNTKQRRKGAKVEGTEFYPVNHADVAAVPKDPTALRMLGQAAAPAAPVAAPAAPQQSHQPSQTPQQAAVPPPAGAAPGKPAAGIEWETF